MNRTGLPLGYEDPDIWTFESNDAFQEAMHTQSMNVVVNGNNPPSMGAGTKFWLWYQDTKTVKNRLSSGNACYPNGQAGLTYNAPLSIWETAQHDFTWNDGAQFPAKANSTVYYLYCYGSIGTYANRGQGKYGATTSAPSYDEMKGGYYVQLTISSVATWCKVVARFEIDGSGNVINVMEYTGKTMNLGFYEGKGLYLNGNALTLQKMRTAINTNYMVTYKQDVIVKADVTTGLSASTWYVVLQNETTGAITYTTILTQTSWTGTTLATNRLNMFSLYDTAKKYCACNDGVTYYRAIGFFKANSGANGIQIGPIDIRRMPPVIVNAWNKNQSVSSSSTTVLGYDNVTIDTCSIISGSTTTFAMTMPFSGIVTVSASAYWTASSVAQGKQNVLYSQGVIDASTSMLLAYAMQPNTYASMQPYTTGTHTGLVPQGRTVKVAAWQDGGGPVTTYNADNYSILSLSLIPLE